MGDDIDGLVRRLVVQLANRLSARDADLIVEMVDHREPVVGFEWLADALCEGEQRISPDERSLLQAVATDIGSDRASRAIDATPHAPR